MRWDRKISIYHILLCWLCMIRIVVVDKDCDVVGVIMVEV